MNYIFTESTTMSSIFLEEEFFPAIVEYSSEKLNNRFIEYNYYDTDMLELSVHPETNLLKRVSLTFCNHFCFKEEDLILPQSTNGTINILDSVPTECSYFMTYIYNNGIHIKTSELASSKHYKIGQVIFSFSKNNELTNVYITNLSKNNILHIKNELDQH